MPLTTVHRGSGITRRQTRELINPNDEDRSNIWELLEAVQSEDWSDDLLTAPLKVLKDFGLPPVWGFYRSRPNGAWERDAATSDQQLLKYVLILAADERWCEVKPAAPELMDLVDLAERHSGEDSDPHFAARIARKVWICSAARACLGPGALTEHLAFDLGRLHARWNMKRDWEAPALSGQQRRAQAAEARERATAARQQRARAWRQPVREAAAEAWAQDAELSVSCVTLRVRKRASAGLPTSDRAIRDAIKDLKPQKVGSD